MEFFFFFCFQLILVDSAPDPDPEATYIEAFAAAHPDEFHAFKMQHRSIFGLLKGNGGGNSNTQTAGKRTILKRCKKNCKRKTTTKSSKKKKKRSSKKKTKSKRCKCRCRPRCRRTTVSWRVPLLIFLILASNF